MFAAAWALDRFVITPVPDSTPELDPKHLLSFYGGNSNSNSSLAMIKFQFGTNSTCGSLDPTPVQYPLPVIEPILLNVNYCIKDYVSKMKK